MKNLKKVALKIFKKKEIVEQFYLLFQNKFSHCSLNVLKINKSDLQNFLDK